MPASKYTLMTPELAKAYSPILVRPDMLTRLSVDPTVLMAVLAKQ